LLIAGIALCAIPASAMANPAYEPNNGIHQAFGPLQANTNYDATISSTTERDWYVVYVSGQGVLDIALTNTDDGCPEPCADPIAYLRDENGDHLNETEAEEGQTANITYTTPGPGTYYIEVRSAKPADRYRLRLTGPVTDGPRPGPAEPTPNASRTPQTAFGPLAGGRLYGGTIDGTGEEDWFFFNTSGPGTFDVKVTNIGSENCSTSSCGPTVYLYDREGALATQARTVFNSTDPDLDRIGHIQFTSPGPEQYFLRVQGGAPVHHYQFEINPASLLTDVTPPHATEACAKAEAKLEKAKEKLATAKANFASKKKLKKLKGKVKAAKKKVKAACGS
jgi:hypothetical protein